MPRIRPVEEVARGVPLLEMRGARLVVGARAWAHGSHTADSLDLYHAANPLNPSWTLIATLKPATRGESTMSGTFTLPSGWTTQAIRAQFRYGGTAGTCTSGAFSDRDDLVFSVGERRMDLNADGHADLLWYNGSTGQLAVWFLKDVTHLSPDAPIGPASNSTILASAGWAMRAVSDFNHDGQNDLPWYNGKTGQFAVWFLNGTTHMSPTIPDALIGPASISTIPASTGWQIKGTDDFDNDGNPDIIWQIQPQEKSPSGI